MFPIDPLLPEEIEVGEGEAWRRRRARRAGQAGGGRARATRGRSPPRRARRTARWAGRWERPVGRPVRPERRAAPGPEEGLGVVLHISS